MSTFTPNFDDPSTFYSVLDCRVYPQLAILNPAVLGEGPTHHDIINFSLADLEDVPMAILKRLMRVLINLQDERDLAADVAVFELPAREHTVWSLEEVLDARGELFVDAGKGKGDEKEKDKK